MAERQEHRIYSEHPLQGRDAVSEAQDAADRAADATSNPADAGAETARRGIRVVRETATTGIRAGARGAEQLTDGATTQQAERLGRGAAEVIAVYSEAVQRVAEQFQSVVSSSQAISSDLPDAHRAVTNWLSQTAEVSTRFTQELLQCRSLREVAQVQTRYVEESIDNWLTNSAEVLRATGQKFGGIAERIAHRKQVGELQRGS